MARRPTQPGVAFVPREAPLLALGLWDLTHDRGRPALEGTWATGGQWTRAICRYKRRRHPVPGASCSCGFYAIDPAAGSLLDELPPSANEGEVLGIIALAGAVRLGRHTSIRAELARPHTLWLEPQDEHESLIEQIAVDYRCAVAGGTDRDLLAECSRANAAVWPAPDRRIEYMTDGPDLRWGVALWASIAFAGGLVAGSGF